MIYPIFCNRGVSPMNSSKAIARICLLGAVLRLFLNPQCSSMILANTQWPHMKFHWCSFLLSVSNKQTACQLQHYLEWHCQTHGYKTSDTRHLAKFLDLMPKGTAGPALECLFEIVAFQPWPHTLTDNFIHFQICVWTFRLTELAVNWTIFALENANAACSILQGFKEVFEWFCRHHKASNTEAWAQLPHYGERW